MLRKVGTLLALGALLLGSSAFAQSGNSGTTHVVLTNDQRFLVSNGKFLSGVYECSEGGYIDISCLLGQFPPMNCPAGQAIQSIDSSLNASCIDVGSGSGPAGADTYIQYNAAGIFGADPNFTWNYTSSILTLGGGGPGTATFSSGTLAQLGTPSDGTIGVCSNCNKNTDPCTTTGSPTGAFAMRLNGTWVCGSPAGGSGTVTSVGLTVPGGTVFGVTGSPVTTSGTLGITATGTLGNFPYFPTTSTVGSTTGLVWNSTKQNITHTAGTLAQDDPIYTNSGTFSTSGGNAGISTFGTTAGSTGGITMYGVLGRLNAGYTGDGYSVGGFFQSLVANTGADLGLGTTNQPRSDVGLFSVSNRSGTGAGTKTGGKLVASGSTTVNYGVIGEGVSNSTAGTSIGVLGIGSSSAATGSNLKNVGGYFDSTDAATFDRALANANVAVFARGSTSSGYVFYGTGAQNPQFAVDINGSIQVNTGGGLKTGVSAVVAVRKGDDSASCNLTFTSGLLTTNGC